MDIIKIRHRIAMEYGGDLTEYFNKIAIADKLIKNNYNMKTEAEILKALESYSYNIENLNIS